MAYLFPFPRTIPRSQDYGTNPGVGPNPAGGHNGDDYATPIGTSVRAAGDGVIIFAGEFDDTYADNWGWNLHYGGKMVILNTDGADGPYFEYGHNSELCVTAGQRVKRGDIIAYTGNTDGGTGVSTGPHCHVGCLEPVHDLGSNTYGRTNPRRYMTDYWEDETEGFLMTLTEQQQKDIYWQLCTEEGRAAQAARNAAALLDETIQRGGAGATLGDGKTTLRGMIAWNDHHEIVRQGDAAGIAASIITELGEDLAADVVAEVGRRLAAAV